MILISKCISREENITLLVIKMYPAQMVYRVMYCITDGWVPPPGSWPSSFSCRGFSSSIPLIKKPKKISKNPKNQTPKNCLCNSHLFRWSMANFCKNIPQKMPRISENVPISWQRLLLPTTSFLSCLTLCFWRRKYNYVSTLRRPSKNGTTRRRCQIMDYLIFPPCNAADPALCRLPILHINISNMIKEGQS